MKAVWVIVFALSNISGIPVLPKERPQGYLSKADCTAHIPEMKRRWIALGMPEPTKTSCEILEMPDK